MNQGWRRRRLSCLLVAGLALASACDDGSTPPAADERARTTMLVETTTVRFEGDVLSLGEVQLRRFVGYQRAPGGRMFGGWPPDRSIHLMSKSDPTSIANVFAAVFEDAKVTVDPTGPIDLAEKGIHEMFVQGAVLDEGVVKGSEWTCTYRVRRGPLGDEPDLQEYYLGTVVAVASRRPSIGLSLAGPASADIPNLLPQVVSDLCPRP
jgi:hypothetical protein